MKMLITGGAGFIGSNYVHLVRETHPDYQIVVVDKLNQQGNKANLDGVINDIEFHEFDLIEEDKLRPIFEQGIDYVVHFAAETNVDRSIENPDAFVSSNVLATNILLRLSRDHHVKRFHHVSTDEVFGSLELDTTDKFNEDTPYDPRSPYSATKAGSDHLVRSYFHTYGLDVTISNCSNNYGPYQVPENIVPVFSLMAIQDKPLTIYGDGKSVRDYLFVLDHCRAIDLILHNGKAGETYCVGGGQEQNGIQIADAVLKITGKPDSLKRFVTDRPGHDRRYAIDYSKLARELGYQPSVTFEEGLKQTIEWYQNHPEWWQPYMEKFYVPKFLQADAERLKEE
ncbi:MAG TPA: dTDP-glucose 4,6-dehydratase [Candidatus Saccharimonadales bacterium]|nr:dTDP-glucose 4,6-dehydratase [Candidatus Saccharimonadales bacterium]